MPAWALKLLEWVVVTFIVPMIQKAYAGYKKAQSMAKQVAGIKKENEVKAEAYEKDPSDSNYSDMP